MPKTVTFRNTGNQDYRITGLSLGRADAGSPFTVTMSPSTGVVPFADGGTVVITVTPNAIPQTSPVTANLYGDVLTVTTDAPMDPPHDIQLRQTARGSIFEISIPGMAINYGSVAVGASGARAFTVNNTGNAPGVLNFSAGQPMSFQMPMNRTIAVGANTLNASFTPMAAMSYTDTSTITAPSPTVLCQPLPFTSVSMTGTGSSGNVVGINPSSLTFGTGGMQNCGTTATAQTITVTNNSTQSLMVTPTLTAGVANFAVSGAITVASMMTGTITVTPNMIPATTVNVAPNGFGGTLSIRSVGGVVDETHVVALNQTARGAILAFSPAGISRNSTGSTPFTVTNTGNVDVGSITLTKGGAAQWAIGATTASATSGSSSSAINATYTRPLLGGNNVATVTMSTTEPRCGPPLPTLTLTGT